MRPRFLSEPKTQASFEAQVLLTYRRDLTNLSLQESRLRRQYEKDEAELKRLLAEREAAAKQRAKEEKARWDNAIVHYRTAKDYEEEFDPAEIGFEFSTEEIERRLLERDRQAGIMNGRYYEYKAEGSLKAA